MALKIRTADGKPFYRCGIKFTGDDVIVPDEKLDEFYGSPEASKKKPILLGEVLLAERMLVCEVVNLADSGQGEPPPEGDPDGDPDKKPSKGKGKGK